MCHGNRCRVISGGAHLRCSPTGCAELLCSFACLSRARLWLRFAWDFVGPGLSGHDGPSKDAKQDLVD
eukprot:5711282-Pyramimonas_sp.AAC.1